MDFVDILIQNVKILESVFDLTAFCYDYLVKNVDDQAVFIGKYILENEQASDRNPNLKALRKFDNEVYHALRYQEEGLLFGACLEKIIDASGNMQKKLEKYEEDFFNQATIPFFILWAIDRYVLDKKGKRTDTAPLNQSYVKDSFIYLNIQDNLLDRAMEENGFADMIKDVQIRYCFQHLCILERKELAAPDAAPPNEVRLWMEEDGGYRNKMLLKKRLKIAVVPLDKEKMLDFPIDEGALFHVEYCEKARENCANRAIRLLELAIDKGANIIIFPEFVCSQEIQNAIQCRLRQMHEESPKRLRRLLVVLAGSGWIDGNNVAAIFSYDGVLLGRQYKTERFSDLKKEGRELIENLEDPGKETTIIEVVGLGKIVIGICRDICNRNYVKRLTEIFCPQLLLVPAWSSSIRMGFEGQLKEITTYNHMTCSIVCDCCEATNGKMFKKEIGVLVTPVKRESMMEGKVCYIRRREKNCRSCHKGGCIIMTNICFETNNVRRGRMVTQIKQINY